MFFDTFGLLCAFALISQGLAQNATYINPMISGWASDPSCVHVNGTFFCATSTFVAFPGLPIYASRDLVNWKLVSHAWNREAQLPGIGARTANQQGGMFAPNLRFRDGVFHCTCVYISDDQLLGTIFTSTDPADDESWSDPLLFNASTIDPDLFWDEDGTIYLTSAGIVLQQIDLKTGALTEPISIWNGTGGSSPEGPHMYKKDGYYYLMIAEGGTELGHSETIARSTNIYGPYEGNPNNPIVSNANTTEYFQTVGHADLFQDGNGHWWASALSTRSGPEWKVYPMGREAVLTAVTWKTNEWPVFTPVRGIESVWDHPPTTKILPGQGPFNDDPDLVDFEPSSSLPKNFYFWRPPAANNFAVSAPGNPHTLQISPLRANLTGVQLSNDTSLTGREGLSFVGRRQTDSLFSFSVDLSFTPPRNGFEAGISIFLTQLDHIDLGITSPANASDLSLVFRQYSTPSASVNNYTNFTSTEEFQSLPLSWRGEKVRLQVWSTNATHYAFAVSLAHDSNTRMFAGHSAAERVSGHSGPFTGVLLGVYNTCNGLSAAGNSTVCPAGGEAYFGRWRYWPLGQSVSASEIVPS